jgi:hypothetical protein
MPAGLLIRPTTAVTHRWRDVLQLDKNVARRAALYKNVGTVASHHFWLR